MSDEEKIRENRLRRMASRQGLILRKSRRRDPRAIDYGDWYLIDARYNYLVATCDNLDQVEYQLLAPVPQLLDVIEEQIRFRTEKAAEYPDDVRNGRTVEALERFAAYVRAVPLDDPRFIELARLETSLETARVVGRFAFAAPDDNYSRLLDQIVVAAKYDDEQLRNISGEKIDALLRRDGKLQPA